MQSIDAVRHQSARGHVNRRNEVPKYPKFDNNCNIDGELYYTRQWLERVQYSKQNNLPEWLIGNVFVD